MVIKLQLKHIPLGTQQHLKLAIDEAEKITPTDYEVSYANTFTSALNKANEVYANMYATQPEINDACTALTEAMTVLDEHKFIVPEINIKNGDTVLEETALIKFLKIRKQQIFHLHLMTAQW